MRGVVVWLTGLPASGKSTMAEALHDELVKRGHAVARLDGDQVRRTVLPQLGHDPAGREGFYRALAGMAALLARQGLVVLVAATAHRRLHRRRARRLAPCFVEVYVATPVDECRRRDPKGLYELALHDVRMTLPGAGVAYEPPTAPQVLAEGGDDLRARRRVVALVEELTAAAPPAPAHRRRPPPSRAGGPPAG
jgi:adenylylsulfate kinase